MGWDGLTQLPLWHEPSRLIEMCYLVAAPRLGYAPPDLKALEASIPGISRRVVLMDEPKLEISASDIRERVSRGLSIHHLVPESVDRYIRQQKLYLD